MSTLAPILQSFFTDRLHRQRQASSHTIASYRDTFQLLLKFVQQQRGRQPSQLTWEDLDASLICAFLDHCEKSRHNSPRTRNLRLTAIRSFFRFASYQEPGQAARMQQILAIPNIPEDATVLTAPREHAHIFRFQVGWLWHQCQPRRLMDS